MKMRHHLIPVRTVIIKRSINNVSESMQKKRESLYTVGGNVSWCNHQGEQYGSSSKLKKNYHVTQQFHSLGWD